MNTYCSTYYDKSILSPVPKTGIYPKKLVYKFGPLAHSWRQDGGPPPPTAAMIAEYERHAGKKVKSEPSGNDDDNASTVTTT